MTNPLSFYIGNLSESVSEADIQTLFQSLASPSAVRIITKNNPCPHAYKFPSRIAFVDFDSVSEETFLKIISFNNTRWKGNLIRVEKRQNSDFSTRLFSTETPTIDEEPEVKKLTARLQRKEVYRLREWYRSKIWKIRDLKGNLIKFDARDVPRFRPSTKNLQQILSNDFDQTHEDEASSPEEAFVNNDVKVTEQEQSSMMKVLEDLVRPTGDVHYDMDKTKDNNQTTNQNDNQNDCSDDEPLLPIQSSLDPKDALNWLTSSSKLACRPPTKYKPQSQHFVHPSRVRQAGKPSRDRQPVEQEHSTAAFSNLMFSFARGSDLDDVVYQRRQMSAQMKRRKR
ncbi:hypothetical protein P9112_014413 [Eukaryota sp. TZLM1-RC]